MIRTEFIAIHRGQVIKLAIERDCPGSSVPATDAIQFRAAVTYLLPQGAEIDHRRDFEVPEPKEEERK